MCAAPVELVNKLHLIHLPPFFIIVVAVLLSQSAASLFSCAFFAACGREVVERHSSYRSYNLLLFQEKAS